MRLILLFFTSFILISCGSNETAPKKLYIDKLENISDEEREMVLGAIARLNEEAGEELISTKKIANGKPVVIRSINQAQLDDDQSVLAHARYLEYHCLIEMRTDLKFKIMTSFVAWGSSLDENTYQNLEESEKAVIKNGMEFALIHEFGHCLGLEHAEDIQNVMYPAIQPNWDERNLLEFIFEIKDKFFR